MSDLLETGKKVDQLLSELTEVTREAQALAVEVTRALHDERRAGRPVETCGPLPDFPLRRP